MAKNKAQQKNKFANNVPPPPGISSSPSLKPVVPKVAATIESAKSLGILVNQDLKFDEALADQFSKALPAQEHDALRAWLEQFATLGKAIKDKITEVENKQRQLEDEQLDLLEKHDALKKDSEIFTKEFAELNPKLEEYKVANAKLINRERELEERESEARNGFANQNEISLKSLRENMKSLEQQRDSIKRDIERADRQLTDSQQKKDEELHQRELEILAQQLELSRKESRLQRKLSEIDREQEYYKEELNKQFEIDSRRWEEKIAQANRRAEAAFAQSDEEEQRLYEYRDLINELNGRDPQSLLNELEELRQAKRHLETQLNNSDVGSLESENDGLKNRIQNLESRLRDVEPALEHAKTELTHQRIGVTEKQGLVAEKKALEKTNQVLTLRFNELSNKIDQLTDAQKSQTPFPALDNMDKTERFQVKPHLGEVSDLKTFAPELQRRIAYAERGVYLNYKLEDIQILLGGLAMSQLHVFQGISGTGKTSLAKAFAKAMGGYCTDIAVQAGWRDRDDLLGHYNAFEKRFYEKDCLQGLYRAQTPAYEDCCNIILLDEMNLSRPEQYFAEFLSALEKNDSNERLITLMESGMENAPKRLAEGRKIRVPQNVWFIGTANHDETTSELADKTYDRSHIMTLPRHESGIKLDKIEVQRFSYASLRKRFDEAIKANKQEVTELLEELTTGSLTTALEEHFNFGWGNRFERQAKQFIPVVMAAGGSKEMALDHLLATRVFRNGKVTGRYDANIDDLSHVEKALNDTWKSWKTPPTICLEALEQDRNRKERGA
jgi:hypothetical protein